MRKSPTETRTAIRRATLRACCRRGYRSTTLQEIAHQVGLTRGAVLHHFNSKADLLAAVVEPYHRHLDAMLDAAVLGDPPTAAEREQLLRDLAAVVLDHRPIVELLAHDLAAQETVGLAPNSGERTRRLTGLLAGSCATQTEQVRAAAALGAILHPVASAWLNLDGPEARATLIDAGLAAINVDMISTAPKGGN